MRYQCPMLESGHVFGAETGLQKPLPPLSSIPTAELLLLKWPPEPLFHVQEFSYARLHDEQQNPY
jgi:hypothetical protein